MPNGSTLELASLVMRHPDLDFSYPHAMMAVIRLSLDPVPPQDLRQDALRRSIIVNHQSPGSKGANDFQHEIGWNGLGFNTDIRNDILNTYNDNEITEKAAIAVAALLVHELGGIRMKRVLPVGEGGDYAAEDISSGRAIQVECSGIKEGLPSASASRLRQKCKQVLTRSPHGYVSVTTFHQIQSGGGIAHSYLHYVESGKPSTAKLERRPRRKHR